MKEITKLDYLDHELLAHNHYPRSYFMREKEKSPFVKILNFIYYLFIAALICLLLFSQELKILAETIIGLEDGHIGIKTIKQPFKNFLLKSNFIPPMRTPIAIVDCLIFISKTIQTPSKILRKHSA